ncbi:MAG: FtsW/RodA/SpoVE family cell cycle protein [Anaerolineales bacterium]|nr:FtsW/RodA/SpoVE family cell cycle protein [Anaerolineales bacterium]
MLRREGTLFLLAGLFVLACTVALTLAPFARANSWGVEIEDLRFWLLPGTWLACALGAHFVARRFLPQHDPYLLPIAYLLSGWGLAIVWRLAPRFGLRQTLWLAVATAAMLGVVWLAGDLRWLRRYRYTWFVLGLALTALTLFIGVNPEGFGAELWLGGVFGVFLQPAELLKLLLVVFLAAYLADRREQIFAPQAAPFPRFPYFLPLLIMWGFSLLILLAQRDLGMGTLFFLVFLVMVYLASGQAAYVLVGLMLLLLGGLFAYAAFDVVRLRVEAWWDPWADPSGRSFQIVQSLIAVAEGGVFGRGPGLGAPGLVPVAHSDFLFAALAEEWGLLGMIGALALLGAFVLRGLHIAARARNAFDQLLAAGLSALTGLQALLIIGGVIKVVPLTGVTLPFMSYGGSSLLVQFIMLGLLLRLSGSQAKRGL